MAAEHDGTKPAATERAWTRWLPLAVLAALMLLAVSQGWHRFLSPSALVEHKGALDAFVAANRGLALGAYILAYAAAVSLSLPGGVLLTIAGGLLFGWLLGGGAALVGATTGAAIVFTIARTSLGQVLASRAGPQIERLRQGFNRDAFNYLLFLRLVPAFPFWLVNLAPALLGVPLRTFVAATAIGIVPGTFVFAYLGAGLDSVVEAQADALEACRQEGGNECGVSLDLGDFVTAEMLIAFAALGMMALVPIAWRRLRGTQTPPGEG